MTFRFGVLGHPVAHSLSPDIHRTFYQRHGIDATYERVDVAPADLPRFLDQLREEGGFHGLNVTTPHKQALFAATRHHDAVAQACRAVNTLSPCVPGDWAPDTLVPGKVPFRAHNTDGAGFVRALREEHAFDPRGKRVLMLGAGGAAKSVLCALQGEGPAELRVWNRSADRLADPFFAPFDRATGDAAPLLARADLVIHASSFGLGGGGEPFPWPPASFAGPLVIDLNYRAGQKTPFLAALPPAATAHDGRGMLLHQAAEAFRIWFGYAPDTRGMLAEL